MITDKLDKNSPETKAEATKAVKTSFIFGGLLGIGFWWLTGWHVLGLAGGCIITALGWVVMMAAQAPTIAKNDQVRREEAMLAELKRANDLAEEANRIAEGSAGNERQ